MVHQYHQLFPPLRAQGNNGGIVSWWLLGHSFSLEIFFIPAKDVNCFHQSSRCSSNDSSMWVSRVGTINGKEHPREGMQPFGDGMSMDRHGRRFQCT